MSNFFPFKRLSALHLLFVLVLLASSSCETVESMMQKKIRAVEKGLLESVTIEGQPLKTFNLEERMQYYRVPGLLLLIFDHHRVDWMKPYGFREAGTASPVTANTLFQVGELSEPLTALAVMSLAEKNIIEVDGDVNRYLLNWNVPENNLTRESPVTLRTLLSHTAGFPYPALPSIQIGEPVQTTADILRGRPPAKNDPLQVRFKPGSEVGISAAGYAVVQQILEDITGESFADYIDETVLRPLNLLHASFDPLPLDHLSREASSGHSRTGEPLENGRSIQAVPASSGLWTSAENLASFILSLVKTAQGEEPGLISPSSARLMLTPVAANMAMGLNVDDRGNDLNLNRWGKTDGFSSYLIFYPERGQGAVLLSNSVNGQYLIEEILRSLAAAYDWPHFKPQEKKLFRLDPEVYSRYVGRYEINPDYILDVRHEDYYLVIQPSGQAPTRFYVENPTTFFSTSPYIQIQFLLNPDNSTSGLILRQSGTENRAKKIG
ncbi:MAG: serine hydrolase [Acidobacteria bacterium]|nr:serine hydrolase [Acidobacteriota bacterium]